MFVARFLDLVKILLNQDVAATKPEILESKDRESFQTHLDALLYRCFNLRLM